MQAAHSLVPWRPWCRDERESIGGSVVAEKFLMRERRQRLGSASTWTYRGKRQRAREGRNDQSARLAGPQRRGDRETGEGGWARGGGLENEVRKGERISVYCPERTHFLSRYQATRRPLHQHQHTCTPSCCAPVRGCGCRAALLLSTGLYRHIPAWRCLRFYGPLLRRPSVVRSWSPESMTPAAH
jgi:hypothetical protein